MQYVHVINLLLRKNFVTGIQTTVFVYLFIRITEVMLAEVYVENVILLHI